MELEDMVAMDMEGTMIMKMVMMIKMTEMIVVITLYQECALNQKVQVINAHLKIFMVIKFKLRSPLSDGFTMRVLANVSRSCILVVVVIIIGLKRKLLVMMYASLNHARKIQRNVGKEKSIARTIPVENKSIDIWHIPTCWVNKGLVSSWIT